MIQPLIFFAETKKLSFRLFLSYKIFIMKKLMDLKGVKTLNKLEQRHIQGGTACNHSEDCEDGPGGNTLVQWLCINRQCVIG